MDENDTCREYVLPAIHAAGWLPDLVREQFAVEGENRHRLNDELTKRRADYVLELAPGQPLMVIEAKRSWAAPGDGLQQATRYATKLDVPFAVSTNGHGWVLYNSVTGLQSNIESLPTPGEAWDLFCESHNLNEEAKELLLSGFSDELKNPDGTVRQLRYYQRRAVHEVLSRLATGEKRLLLVMATGTGKTMTAMQLVWKLWNHRKRINELSGTGRSYKVLFLADRKVLVDDPLNKTFRPVFGDPVIRVKTQERRFSRDIYFATYQALDSKVRADSDADAEEASLLSHYPPDFFDLVIVDEGHRGSAREDSSWRQILEHFSGAAQVGLTATPVQKSDADTFDYFGNPVFEYSCGKALRTASWPPTRSGGLSSAPMPTALTWKTGSWTTSARRWTAARTAPGILNVGSGCRSERPALLGIWTASSEIRRTAPRSSALMQIMQPVWPANCGICARKKRARIPNGSPES